MSRVEVRCRLGGWANPTINLFGVEMTAAVTATDDGWEERGRLALDNAETMESLTLLREASPFFTLRFDDGGENTVTVHPADDDGWFTMTEYTGPD